MNLLDVGIILFLVAAIIRGRELGLVQQAGSTLGFFGGLFAGAFLQRYLADLASSPQSQALLSLFIVMACAFIFLSIGELLGTMLKYRINISGKEILNKLDAVFGSAMAAVTLLVAVWLVSSILTGNHSVGLQKQLHGSKIVATLTKHLPAAPDILAGVGDLINPNGFPKVFVGLEPQQNTNAPLPSVGDMQDALFKTRESIVKISGKGCGGVVNGSGFIAGDGMVITNAHVVAGVNAPRIIDGNGEHAARVTWFDPDLDLAVLRTTGLKGVPLTMQSAEAADGTPGFVGGYPGGGDFTASLSSVLDTFRARGRNIYNQGSTNREVYSLKADIRPGNSGGPVINKAGEVIGVVFAESTTYEDVGYALTVAQVAPEIAQAKAQTTAVSNGTCTE